MVPVVVIKLHATSVHYCSFFASEVKQKKLVEIGTTKNSFQRAFRNPVHLELWFVHTYRNCQLQNELCDKKGRSKEEGSYLPKLGRWRKTLSVIVFLLTCIWVSACFFVWLFYMVQNCRRCFQLEVIQFKFLKVVTWVPSPTLKSLIKLELCCNFFGPLWAYATLVNGQIKFFGEHLRSPYLTG